MAKPRIFVSSTYYDLRHIRDRLEAFIEAYGYEAVLFESGDIPFRSDVALDESCYSEVRLCHILILIIGSRYGSPASDGTKDPAADLDERYKFYNSITRKEYLTARERDIPIFVFVEESVLAEYETYKRNKDRAEAIQYAHVDNVNVFRLIDDIVTRERNNFVRGFERFDDIGSWLRDQWAGLFADFVARHAAETNLRDLATRIAELGQVTAALKEYSESIIRKLQPAVAQEIIDRQEKRLSEGRIRGFAEEPLIHFLLGGRGRPDDDIHRTPESLYRAFEQTRTLEGFLTAAEFTDSFVKGLLERVGPVAQRDYRKIAARFFDRFIPEQPGEEPQEQTEPAEGSAAIPAKKRPSAQATTKRTKREQRKRKGAT